MIDHDINRIEIQRVEPVSPQDVASKLTLEGCEAKPVISIPLQQKLIEAVAQPTNAVVKHY